MKKAEEEVVDAARRCKHSHRQRSVGRGRHGDNTLAACPQLQDVAREARHLREKVRERTCRVARGVARGADLLQGQFNHSSAALAQRLQHTSAVVLYNRIPANNSPARAYAHHNIGVINLTPGTIARVE